MHKKSIGAIILAAGASSRMGENKLLLPFGHPPDTVLDNVINAAKRADLSRLLLVSGNCRYEIETIAKQHGIKTVFNSQYLRGQANSIRRGLEVWPKDMAAMFLLGDQPHISPNIINILVAAYTQKGSGIIVPRSPNGKRGNPVIFPPNFFPELLSLSGDEGGRSLFKTNIESVMYVDMVDDTVIEDMDNREQYEKLRKKYSTEF